MAKKSASGSGSINKRADGRWEARYTYRDALGNKKRGSVYGATQAECRKKLTARLAEIDNNDYHGSPERYTLGQWLDIWLDTYCTELKPMTLSSYKSKINHTISPLIGAVRLLELNNVQLQQYYNALHKGTGGRRALSPKSVQNVHGILHKALKQAVIAGLLRVNPADNVVLPKVRKPELHPLMDDDIAKFLAAIKGDRFETLYRLALFSGLRESELLGLKWEDVDFEAGVITVRRQLQRDYTTNSLIFLDETKNGKTRKAAIAKTIVADLRAHKIRQLEWQLAAGAAWQNVDGLIFTTEFGNPLPHHVVYRHFKKIVAQIGCPDVRLHDLRHTYAITALQNGDSIKDVQEQLGHYSSAFTMDTYAAQSETMRRASQERMEAFIQAQSG